ncbi:MAG: choice-of-anchor Q domain-containing protein [Candidatus Hodarchaeota archaeon]
MKKHSPFFAARGDFSKASPTPNAQTLCFILITLWRFKLATLVTLVFASLVATPAYVFSYVSIAKGCTTAFYIDKDCDGYGVGTGYVTGMDADDEDASINNLASVEAVYGELDSGDPVTAKANLLNFLANRKAASYTGIDDIYYISTTGNNSTGKPNDYRYPFADFNNGVKLDSNFGPGDLIVWRGGTYNTTINHYGQPGEDGSPIISMSFPGEKAILQGTSTIGVLYLSYNTSWLTFDSIQFGPDTGSIGANGWHTAPSYTQSNIIVRYCEFLNLWQGTRCQYKLYNILMEYCVSHHNTGGGSHTNYWGGTGCYNQTFRGCIFYANIKPYPLFQWNGTGATNLRWEGCIFHSGGHVALSLLNGIDNSYVVNCLFFNNNRNDILLYTYSTDWYGVADNNQIINNTFWRGNTTNEYGTSDPSAFASVKILNNVDSVPQTGNIFRNNVWHAYDSRIFNIDNSAVASATYIDHNIIYRQNDISVAIVSGTSYSFSEFEDSWVNINSNSASDPSLVDVSVDYYLTPSKFDFSLSASSPAIDFGISAGAPKTDLRGYLRSGNPDAGCYEYSGADPPKPPDEDPPAPPIGLKVLP